MLKRFKIKTIKTTYKDSTEVCRHFLAQDSVNGANKIRNLFYEESILYSYGYHFPLARIIKKGKKKAIFINENKYISPNTNRTSRVTEVQKSILLDVLTDEFLVFKMTEPIDIPWNYHEVLQSRTNQFLWECDKKRQKVELILSLGFFISNFIDFFDVYDNCTNLQKKIYRYRFGDSTSQTLEEVNSSFNIDA